MIDESTLRVSFVVIITSIRIVPYNNIRKNQEKIKRPDQKKRIFLQKVKREIYHGRHLSRVFVIRDLKKWFYGVNYQF